MLEKIDKIAHDELYKAKKFSRIGRRAKNVYEYIVRYSTGSITDCFLKLFVQIEKNRKIYVY